MNKSLTSYSEHYMPSAQGMLQWTNRVCSKHQVPLTTNSTPYEPSSTLMNPACWEITFNDWCWHVPMRHSLSPRELPHLGDTCFVILCLIPWNDDAFLALLLTFSLPFFFPSFFWLGASETWNWSVARLAGYSLAGREQGLWQCLIDQGKDAKMLTQGG